MNTTTQTPYTDTATLNSTILSLADLQRIARSLQRSLLMRRYSRGTFKRSAMAMINHYLRQTGKNFAKSGPREMHVAM